MGEYDAQIAMARRLIEQKGQAVTLNTLTPGGPVDTDKPWGDKNPDVITPSDEHAAFFKDKREGEDGITRNVSICYISTDVEITTSSVIVRGGDELTVTVPLQLAPNEQTIMYELELAG